MNQKRLTAFKEWFSGYCRGFYTDDEEENRNYLLKEEHTRQVCARMRQLAIGEGFAEPELILAETIALFHDLGRFEQYRRFRTFKDSISINHALLAVQLLEEHGVLAGLPLLESELISQAVLLHNAFSIPDNLSVESRLFATMVRDADKLDIWRLFIDQFALPPDERPSALSLGIPESDDYTASVVASIRGGDMVRLDMVKTLNDFKLLQLSWLYDLNYSTSYRLVVKEDYIGRLGAMLPATEEIAELLDILRCYVEEREQSTPGVMKKMTQAKIMV